MPAASTWSRTPRSGATGSARSPRAGNAVEPLRHRRVRGRAGRGPGRRSRARRRPHPARAHASTSSPSAPASGRTSSSRSRSTTSRPCGGDFYARGHLRTLARVLGVDVAPLLTSYDERYADAPINPRRVFEAELATGAHGSIRGTRGGPNWSVLIAAVMALVLAWSIARLIMDSPVELRGAAPILNGSAGVGRHRPQGRAARPGRAERRRGRCPRRRPGRCRARSSSTATSRSARHQDDQGVAAGAGAVHRRLAGDHDRRPASAVRSVPTGQPAQNTFAVD